MKLHEIVDARNKTAADMRAMHEAAETESRGFTPEERETWDKMDADMSALDERIERAKDVEGIGDIDLPVNRLPADNRDNSDDDASGELTYEAAHRTWMKYGLGELTREERNVLNGGKADFTPAESRAMGVATGGAGGYTVPEGFGGRIIETMKQFGGVINQATILDTESGNDLPFPTNNDTGNVGELLAENAQAAAQDAVFGQATLSAYKFSSKIVLVSLELLQDNGVNIESYLASIMGKRIGRASASYLATGTGSSQPQGIVTGATLSQAAAGASAITFADMINVEHKVDPSYRANGAGMYLFNDATLKALKGIVDSEGRPLWLPSVADAAPATINGRGFQIDQGIADVGTGDVSVVFGDLSAFYVRQVMGITMLRLVERYAEYGQVGFLAFARQDSHLMDAGAVAKLTHP